MTDNTILIGARTASALLLALTFVLSGCDSGDKEVIVDSKDDGAGVVDQSDGSAERSGYLPFRIAFKKDGTAVILDEKGREEKWEPVKFPLETKALYKVETVTLAFVQGSCTITAQNVGSTGLTVGKKYPDAVCRYLGVQ